LKVARKQTQVERCKKEMDYLQSKLKENLHEDTKAMVKFMKEDNDAKKSNWLLSDWSTND
jgi:hypothetical protein